MPSKVCSKCQQEKPLSEFHNNSNSKDGKHWWCKQCRKEYRQTERGREVDRRASKKYARTPKGREVRRKALRKYAKTEKGKQVYERAYKKYHEQNKDRKRAHWKVFQAVQKGILPHISTQTCNRCGAPAIHYHHHSYKPEHWLDVKPLCHKCHVIEHFGKMY